MRSEVLHTPRGDFEALVDGPEDGPLVLLLHGFPELNVSWSQQIPVLAAAGYRVVAPNQRGYAGSVRGGSYLTSDLAADVVAMIDSLGEQRVILVGHDWGGGVAWTTAGLYPERVQALVAMNCPPPRVLVAHLLRSPAQLRKSWYVFFFQLPVLPERFVSQNMPKTLVAGSYNRTVWNREVLTPYADAFATPGDAAGPVSWYRGALRERLRHPRRRMPRLAMPVLIIWGVHDQFLGRELVEPEALLGTLAYGNVADVVEVADAGHFVQNEAPEQVNEALLGWLRRNLRVDTGD
jgi:epoxide hydrolase 4